MEILYIVLYMLCISFCHYAYIKSCSLIFNLKIRKFLFKEIFIILFITVLTYYNTFYNYNFSKILISFIFLMVIFKIIFKEKLKEIFLKLINVYLLGWIIETFVGALIVGIFIDNLETFDMTFLKIPLSILIMLVLLLVSYIKPIRRIIFTIYKYLERSITLLFVLISSIICLVVLTFYYITVNDIISQLAIFVLVITFVIFLVTSILQIFNIKNIERKQDILLEFMKKYETIIDNESINKHEYLNNLLVLKGMKNKNSKDYNEILDEIILNYKPNKTYNRIYNLPSGIKGLLYYKIYEMQEVGIEPFIDISNEVVETMENMNSKTLYKVCKILGIILDNAKESSQESDEKNVIIDVYKDEKNVIIYVENSINKNLKNLDTNKIKERGFSTKGNSRGIGLYLVNEILRLERNIFLTQKIEGKRFVSVIKIKAS